MYEKEQKIASLPSLGCCLSYALILPAALGLGKALANWLHHFTGNSLSLRFSSRKAQGIQSLHRIISYFLKGIYSYPSGSILKEMKQEYDLLAMAQTEAKDIF